MTLRRKEILNAISHRKAALSYRAFANCEASLTSPNANLIAKSIRCAESLERLCKASRNLARMYKKKETK